MQYVRISLGVFRHRLRCRLMTGVYKWLQMWLHGRIVSGFTIQHSLHLMSIKPKTMSFTLTIIVVIGMRCELTIISAIGDEMFFFVRQSFYRVPSFVRNECYNIFQSRWTKISQFALHLVSIAYRNRFTTTVNTSKFPADSLRQPENGELFRNSNFCHSGIIIHSTHPAIKT